MFSSQFLLKIQLNHIDLEELHSNTCKHELKECGDNQDVANGAYCHEHTLHHILQTHAAKDKCEFQIATDHTSEASHTVQSNGANLKSLGPVDGTKGPEHTQHSKYLHHRDCT